MSEQFTREMHKRLEYALQCDQTLDGDLDTAVRALFADYIRLRSPVSDVRRYACFTWKDGVYEHAQGEHVAYTDYERLARRVAEMESLEELSDEAIEVGNTRIGELERELAEIAKERQARNKIDPVTRLHNLCDHLAEQRGESPFTAEALDLQDAAYREMCRELKEAQETARKNAEDAEKWRKRHAS